MRFSLFVAALLPLAFASPVSSTEDVSLARRATNNAAAIVSNFAKLKKEVTQLNTTLNTIPDNAKQGSIPVTTELALERELNAIKATANKLAKEAKTTSKFSNTQSASVYKAIASNETPTFDVLDNLIAHKQAAANNGIQSDVESGLKTIAKKVALIAKEIEAASTATYAKKDKAIAATLAKHFQAAIAAYKS